MHSSCIHWLFLYSFIFCSFIYFCKNQMCRIGLILIFNSYYYPTLIRRFYLILTHFVLLLVNSNNTVNSLDLNSHLQTTLLALIYF